MTVIDSTARIAAGASIGHDVVIGPYCVIGPNVTVAEGCHLVAHVHVTANTTIGARTRIQPFASLGTPPQSVHYRGEPTRLVIGADCDIRENVTMNIGTVGGGGVTTIGDRCMFMVGSHIGHDCTVGNGVTLANNAVLGGHVTVEDFVFIGGNSAIHQHTRIGESAMISGMCGVRGDVIPFGFAIGAVGRLTGLNTVGMKRRRMTRADLHAARAAYNRLFKGEGVFADRLAAVSAAATEPIVRQIAAFLQSSGKRPILMARPRGTVEDDPIEG